nr:DUF6387 family protein [Cupriavidus sp. DB3]
MRYALDGLPVLEQCIAYEKEREGDDLSVPNLPWQKYRSVIGQSFDDYVRENEIFHAGTQVNVDLNASDSEILADFKDWLAQKRRAAGSMAAKRRTDNKDFESWVKNRVLPYIDLLLLSQATGRPLTHSLAGELLFWDEDVDATEKVRKTVRPLAMQLLDSQFIAAIERQPDGVEGKS